MSNSRGKPRRARRDGRLHLLPFFVMTMFVAHVVALTPGVAAKAAPATASISGSVDAAGQCVLDQIVNDRTRATGAEKNHFDILINDLDTNSSMWEAPYITVLGQRGDVFHGWISGDRAGYKGAYMFLVEWTEDANGLPDWARVLGRVTFNKVGEAGYVQINDRYMAEIQTTGIKFNGTCGGTSQAEQPGFDIDYEPNDEPDFRPVIHYVDAAGVLLEDRSYTNTDAHPNLRFSEHERIASPFSQVDGFGATHTVYERVTVLARYDEDGDGKDFLPAVSVYYDTLVPDVTLTGEGEGGPGGGGAGGGGTSPIFADIGGSIFEADIVWLAESGITKGCNPPSNTLFCPGSTVTRGQMAAFLVRALDLPAGSATFTDVGDSIFEADINALAEAGITKGCDPPANTKFCPDAPVTRAQMAAFLVRALDLEAGPNAFQDDNGLVFEADINALAASGITKGCNPPANSMFCPSNDVSREQMAAFLHRAEPWLPSQ